MDIGRAHVDAWNAIPDTIWETKIVAGQRMQLGRANYAKPGVYQRTQREIFEAEMMSLGAPRMSPAALRIHQFNRFEDELAEKVRQRRSAS